MARTKFKKIPFDLELAKKITNKEVKGRIVSEDGRKVRIIYIDNESFTETTFLAMYKDKDFNIENYYRLNKDGRYFRGERSDLDLHLEVSNNELNRIHKKLQTMTRTKFKKIPFDLELAKKITNKEVKGRIVTEDNLTARIVCFDLKYGADKILAVLVDCGGEYEIGVRCNLDGTCRDDRKEDKFNLHIEVPTYYRDYSNFVPQRWQTCLVRDNSLDIWRVAVCSGKDAYGRPLFYSERNTDGCCGWYHYLPLSKVTERLIGISKSYEEQLIKELDGYGQD